MATHWISPTGSDGSGDGSQGNPWFTLQFAHDQAVANDTIKVISGTYSSSLTTGSELVVSKNITISGFSDGNVEYPIFTNTNTLTGDYTFIGNVAGNHIVTIERIIYIWNGNRSGNRVGGIANPGGTILDSGSSNWTVRNVVLLAEADPGNGRSGMMFSTYANIVLAVNVVADGWQDCFFFNSNNGGNPNQNCVNCVAQNATQTGFRRANTTFSHNFNNVANFLQSSQSNNTTGDPFFISPGSPNFDYRLQYVTGGFGSNDSSLVDSGDTGQGTDFNIPPARATSTIDKGAYGGPNNGDSTFIVDDEDLFDGELSVFSSDTDLFDGEVIIFSSESDNFDGEIMVTSSESLQFDGEIMVVNADSSQFDGEINIRLSNTSKIDGNLLVYNDSTIKSGSFLWTTTEDFLRNIDFGDRPTLSNVRVEDGTLKLRE